MSLYKDASLVMIPSAYKDGKLYSIRPIPEYGSELVTNGSFDADSDWTKQSGWTISGGTANCDGTNDVAIYQNISSSNTTLKRITFSVSNYVSGTLRVYSGSGLDTFLNVTANGTYEVESYLVLNRIFLYSLSSFNGSVDNISVKEVIKGDGDFTFSRGSNLAATRVDVNGLIEKGRENHLLQSNQFDTTWTTPSSSVTSGQSGYDGSNDAWLLNTTGVGGYVIQSVSLTGVQTLSVYAKAGSNNFIRVQLNGAGADKRIDVNLIDGSTGTAGGGNITASTTSIGGGWWRIQVVANTTSTGARFYAIVADGDLSASSGNIYIQDAQLEAGLVATDYIETTSSTAQAGILEDTPRLDYSGGASCPALLLEPQRTNEVTDSEYYSNWTKANTTITSNDAISPEGYLNASRYQGDGTNSVKFLYKPAGSITSGNDYTWSAFVKKGTLNYCQLIIGSATFDNALFSNFDLLNGTIGSNGGGAIPFIESYGDDWYRVGITATADASGTATPFIVLANSSTMSRVAGFATSDYIYVYGAQFEQGSYPTSYIPTYGASVTRSGDACYLQNTDVHSSGAGTIFFEVGDYDTNTSASGFNKILVFDEVATTSLDNVIYFEEYAGDNTILIRKGGSTLLQSTPNYQDLRGSKIAIKWSSEEAKIFIDGVLNKTYTGDASLDIQYFGFDNPYNGDIVSTIKMKQLVGFPTALTDSECIALTE